MRPFGDDSETTARGDGDVTPDFHRRVLDNVPAPILVLDVDGVVVYANQALQDLGDGDLVLGERAEFTRLVHPDDAEGFQDVFDELVSSPSARLLRSDLQHGEALVRLRTRSGREIAVEVLTRGAVYDEGIGGIICHVRALEGRQIIGDVLRGLSRGDSLHQLLSRVAELISFPPLDLGTVILRSDDDGRFEIGASNSPKLSEIVHAEGNRAVWFGTAPEPVWIGLERLSATTRNRLRALGAAEICWVSVSSPLTSTELRIISVTRAHPFPLARPTLRVQFAADLAASCLLRTRADALLDFAAGPDALTGLANAAAFRRNAEQLPRTGSRGGVHVFVDGLDRVRSSIGSTAADGALRIVADRLRALVGPADLLGRIDDDEFALVLADENTADEMRSRSLQVAQQAHAAASESVFVAGRQISLTASVGVAVASVDIGTDELLTWADAAMADARRSGGGRIQRYGVAFG